MNQNRKLLLAALVSLPAVIVTALLVAAPFALAASPDATVSAPPGAWQWGMVAAALATGLSSLGAAFAVGKIGAAAVGALAEKPELFGRLLIFLGLAEGIAIYGLIVSILLINRLT